MEQPFERGITCSDGSIDHEATTSIGGGSSRGNHFGIGAAIPGYQPLEAHDFSRGSSHLFSGFDENTEINGLPRP